MSIHFSASDLHSHNQQRCQKIQQLLHAAIAAAKTGQLDSADKNLADAQKLSAEIPTWLAGLIEKTKNKISAFKTSTNLSDALVITPGLSDDPTTASSTNCHCHDNSWKSLPVGAMLGGVIAGVVLAKYSGFLK